MGQRSEVATGMEIVDPDRVPDTFVEGCASVEHTEGGDIRYTLYASRSGERIVVVRLVYPPTVARKINRQSRAFLEGQELLSDAVPVGIVPN